MTLRMMSSILSRNRLLRYVFFWLLCLMAGCDFSLWNNPYPTAESGKNILYASFAERPKHLDPAIAYSSDEYALIAQIYEPPFQYHYLKRPFQLVPLTAEGMPEIVYLDQQGHRLQEGADEQTIAYTDYVVTIRSGIRFQPHPAFSQNATGNFLYHSLGDELLANVSTIGDFAEPQSRELTAEDYVYQIKRLAHPKLHSPIAGIMQHYIEGFAELQQKLLDHPQTDLRQVRMSGVQTLDKYRYKIRIKGKYPQFRFWLAMPFFAPMPWEADVFYNQPELKAKNITLDWFPVGTGPYLLAENNPNRRMILQRNPFFHDEFYPQEGEAEDESSGLLTDAGKKLPFVDRVVYVLEKETIPYWNKFLQGYYDASRIASDSFDQAIEFTSDGQMQLTSMMRSKGIQLQTSVETSIFYMGFNMLDPVVGGYTPEQRKLRRAISIAIDYEEYISIFLNGRGMVAHGVIPPGIFGHAEGQAGMNPFVYDWVNGRAQRKSLTEARQLMVAAGYPQGMDPQTGEALVLYFDTTAVSVDDRPRMNWFRKQFDKLGIKLIIRATDYNRFREKMRNGSGQFFMWGWNADYPDPENFFFLLYGPNGKVKTQGENAVNYENTEFDDLFEQMRNMDNNEERYYIIEQMQQILRRDAPWVFGFYPQSFGLFHGWYKNLKPNQMANNRLKYTRVDPMERMRMREQWNQALIWPLIGFLFVIVLLVTPAIRAYRLRLRERLQ